MALERAKQLEDADYDLGAYSRKISTKSADVQKWFDRGLNWAFGFNHEAAIRCFEAALELEPECAICHWAIAYCNGVNYNNQDLNEAAGKFPSNADGVRYTASAAKLQANASKAEQLLIDAVQVRFKADEIPKSCEERRIRNNEYAVAMKRVYESCPGDSDIAALYAEAMMNVYPWDLWVDGKVREADPLFAGTARILAVLKGAMELHPDHPGLLHFYLHAMEMAPTPQDCLAECARLRDLSLDNGHLRHMPSHIDVLVGHYQDAVTANAKAITADRKYIERNGCDNFFMLYCCHDCHMMAYAAMLAGDQGKAAAAAAEVREWLTQEKVEKMLEDGMADFLESFIALHMHVKVRFGQWREILDEPLPQDENLHCVTAALTRYARVLAHAALKDVDNAAAELARFKDASSKVPESRTLFNNTCQDILAVAAAIADGEVAYRRGDFAVAFGHLRRAVSLDDGMLYDEPWGWMQPARHALGALLLEQGLVDEAVEVYREDLKPGRHPHNVWSLHGLAECLQKSPSLATEPSELEQVRTELEHAQKCADVSIKSSCFCRLSAC